MYSVSFFLKQKNTDVVTALLEEYFDTLSCFEDETAELSNVLDENGFYISSRFVIKLILQDKTYAHLVEALLNSEQITFEQFQVVEIIDQDWLKICYENFKPISIGRFFIHSSYAPEVVPKGQCGLMIDAATAFGSGEHQTTKGCLTAIDQILKEQTITNVLDMGCGSGILGLAIGIAKPTSNIIGVDIDPKAVDVARHNATLNGVPNFSAVTSDGFASLKNDNKFDLIVANILASPLINISADMKAVSHDKTVIVLSGLLTRQKDAVLAAYFKVGFQLKNVVQIDDWSTLVLS
jgi:ribosomal protein L11 methyltransferase